MEPNSESTSAMAWFERELKREIPDDRVDYVAVEAHLFDRILSAQELGPLAALKCSETPPEAMFDRVEHDLLRRIQEHEEYDIPVNDVISSEQAVSDPEWDRITDNLDERISRAAELEPWEQVLKADQIVPDGVWERVEDKLLKRIERERKLSDLARQPVWSFLFLNLWATRRYVGAAAMAAVVGLAAWTGLRIYDREFRSIPTLVYQAQGPSASRYETLSAASERFASVSGGVVTIVNQHGYVELRNGSGVTVRKTTASTARYEIDLGQSGSETPGRGQIRFFVQKRDRAGSFVVTTRDYDISVMGTYFSMEPDLHGRTATHVFEGAVRIRSALIGDTVLMPGQTLRFDQERGAYRIVGGGPILDRAGIPQVPAMDLLHDFRLLRVVSGVDGADVRIDGLYCGTTPLVILQSPGTHQVSIAREGFTRVDTTIEIGLERQMHRLDMVLRAVPGKPGPEMSPRTIREPPRLAERPAATAVTQTAVGAPAPKSENVYRRALEAAQDGRWNEAILLYKEVCDDPGAPSLRRQDALFAVGKIYADRLSQRQSAREEFLTYLALYPDGFFAGEAWLRMAELEMGTDVEKSIEYYLRYLDKYPRHHRRAEIQHRVGLLLLQQKEHRQAIGLFRQALSSMIHEDRELRKSIYLNLHKALKENGEESQAQQIMQEFLSRNR